MPRKKKEDVQLEDELEKKGKKGGKKGKTSNEPKEDTEVETITVEEAIALLAGEEKGKKKKINPYKGMDIHQRNLIDPEKFIFKTPTMTYITEKVDCDSLHLNSPLGIFAYGACDMNHHVWLHQSLSREHAYHVFLHELTHAEIFSVDTSIFNEDEFRFDDEALCQFVSNNFDSIKAISEEFLKSAFYKSFDELEY